MNQLLRLWMRRIVYTVLLALQASIVLAQPNTVDLITDGVMETFPDSSIVSSSYAPAAIHQIALGILQRNSGVAEPEEVQRVSGALTKTLYEIPREYTGEDVNRFFQSQFEKASFEHLFSCTGRACGSSNDWANDIFKNRILYGPAQNQYYLAYQMSPREQVSPFVSVYIITRGNRRLYAYVEVTEPAKLASGLASEAESTLAVELMGNGFSVLESISFQDDVLVEPAGLEPLIAVLNENPLLEVYIVSHLVDDAELEVVQRRAQTQSDSIVGGLISAGISPSRVSAHGIGPLAPKCGSEACRNRIEVVLR